MSAGYGLLYRGFAHAQMRRICEDVDRPLLSEKYRRGLKATAVVPAIRDFASNFALLQDQRHKADYDPQIALEHSDAVDACNLAELTIQAIASAPEPAVTDFLALLLVNLRG